MSESDTTDEPAVLGYALGANAFPVRLVADIWLVFASISAARHLVYFIVLYDRKLFPALSPTIAIDTVEIIGAVIGWLSIGAPSVRQRLSMLRASTLLIGGSVLLAAAHQFWEYGHGVSIGTLPQSGRAGWSELIYQTFVFLSTIQRAVLPVALYLLLSRELRHH